MELFEAAKKAADAAALDGVSRNGPEISRCIDALNRLKIFPVSYNVLVATQVGKKLRSLTKHPADKIQTVATDLLEMWKKVIIEETTRNKKSGTSNNIPSAKTQAAKVENVKVERVQKEVPVKVEKVSNAQPVKVEKAYKGDSTRATKFEKKEAEVDAVMGENTRKEERHASIKRPSQAPNAPPKLTSLIKCNDVLRDKVRELLVEALSKVANEADDDIREEVNASDPIRVAVAVESVMFEKMGRSNGAQKYKYRSIMFNIKDPNNPDLRRKVLLGEIKPERLISMTAEEMASDQRQRENNQIKEKALFDCERGGAPKATTDQFKCGRCGQRKCTYYQMQTRSADEPMTTYVTCVNCNNHWKFC